MTPERAWPAAAIGAFFATGAILPEVQPAQLWHRQRSDGFVTIPRTMPLILGIIDDLTKGAPIRSGRDP